MTRQQTKIDTNRHKICSLIRKREKSDKKTYHIIIWNSIVRCIFYFVILSEISIYHVFFPSTNISRFARKFQYFDFFLFSILHLMKLYNKRMKKHSVSSCESVRLRRADLSTVDWTELVILSQHEMKWSLLYLFDVILFFFFFCSSDYLFLRN